MCILLVGYLEKNLIDNKTNLIPTRSCYCNAKPANDSAIANRPCMHDLNALSENMKLHDITLTTAHYSTDKQSQWTFLGRRKQNSKKLVSVPPQMTCLKIVLIVN